MSEKFTCYNCGEEPSHFNQLVEIRAQATRVFETGVGCTYYVIETVEASENLEGWRCGRCEEVITGHPEDLLEV